jgi:hypothetical protein
VGEGSRLSIFPSSVTQFACLEFGISDTSLSVDSRLPDCANPAAPAIAVPANPIPDAQFALSGALTMIVTPMIPPIMAIKIGVKELINSGVIGFMVGNPLGQVYKSKIVFLQTIMARNN